MDLNTLKGHGDSVTGLCFASDGQSLATGNIRFLTLEDMVSINVENYSTVCDLKVEASYLGLVFF